MEMNWVEWRVAVPMLVRELEHVRERAVRLHEVLEHEHLVALYREPDALHAHHCCEHLEQLGHLPHTQRQRIVPSTHTRHSRSRSASDHSHVRTVNI